MCFLPFSGFFHSQVSRMTCACKEKELKNIAWTLIFFSGNTNPFQRNSLGQYLPHSSLKCSWSTTVKIGWHLWNACSRRLSGTWSAVKLGWKVNPCNVAFSCLQARFFQQILELSDLGQISFWITSVTECPKAVCALKGRFWEERHIRPGLHWKCRSYCAKGDWCSFLTRVPGLGVWLERSGC